MAKFKIEGTGVRHSKRITRDGELVAMAEQLSTKWRVFDINDQRMTGRLFDSANEARDWVAESLVPFSEINSSQCGNWVRRYVLERDHGTWKSYIRTFYGMHPAEVYCFAEALTFLTEEDASAAIRGKFNAKAWKPVMIEVRLVYEKE